MADVIVTPISCCADLWEAWVRPQELLKPADTAVFKKYVLPYIGNMRLDINFTPILDEIMDDILAERNDPALAMTVRRVTGRFFLIAQKYRLVVSNPASRAKRCLVASMPLYIFSDEQVRSLMETMDNEDSLFYKFQMVTGFSPDECLKIEAGHFFPDHNELIIGGSDSKRRKVILPQVASDCLKREIATVSSKTVSCNGKIFSDGFGNPFTKESIKKSMKRIRKNSGVGGYEWRSCRDYVAVKALRGGATFKDLELYFGCDGRVIVRRYLPYSK
ncbi:MAG: tyrosine-type recombinase/integrase [Lachnospiraceae bacterium]|nr:tyrosine-type recombinase/integrase [Lachnospiraceae bacterium]